MSETAAVTREALSRLPPLSRGLLLVFTSLTAGCEKPPDQPSTPVSERISIAVTSYPLLAMAKQIAGDSADIELVVSNGTSPDWKPQPGAIRKMQQSRRILISGGDYEPWLQRVTLPRSRLIDTARGYYDQLIRVPDAVMHQHGPEGGHSHPGIIWATWLDPRLVISQLDQTRDVLLEILPDSEASIRKASDGLAQEFRRLDVHLEEIAAMTADVGITVLGDAPVYQYLVERLGWHLNYVHVPAQSPLSEKDRGSLQKAIAEYQPTLVFVRSTLADELERMHSDSEAPFVLIDLCQIADDDQTLVQRMAQNLDVIQRSIPH